MVEPMKPKLHWTQKVKMELASAQSENKQLKQLIHEAGFIITDDNEIVRAVASSSGYPKKPTDENDEHDDDDRDPPNEEEAEPEPVDPDSVDMTISVRVPPDRLVVALKTNPTDTIGTIKAMLHNMLNIPRSHQRLLFEGRDLMDHLTLMHYDIIDGSVLDLDTLTCQSVCWLFCSSL